MEEKRNFKIINLTGLDSNESEDIVKILNEVMTQRNMESGRKVVEFIIRDYKRKNEIHKAERQEMKDEINQLKKEMYSQYDTLSKHVAVSTSLKELIHNITLT